MGKWDAHRADIQRMVDAGDTDAQIGAVYGVSGATIGRARKLLRIPAAYDAKHKRKPAPGAPPPVEDSSTLTGVTYVDEAGLTVTRYPARYAANALIQSVTARPRRG